MILIINHLGGERFVVEHLGDGKKGNEVILAPPESVQVTGRPNSDLRQDLRWYLEDFLDDPFPAEIQIAEDVLNALKGWGGDCFQKLFTGRNEASWYGDAYAGSFKDFTIKVSSNDPSVISWPWEALYDANANIFLAHNAGFERQLGDDLPDPPRLPDNLPKDRLNILLVIARPGGDADIGFHAVARPLVELAQEHPWVRVDVLRPPTFDELRTCLEEKPGFYHVIHFDGHGDQGLLVFEDDQGNPDRISAEILNQLLFRHRFPFMVLNACRSGKMDERAEDPFAATATALIRAGVLGVVAMGYNLYVSGAQQFVPAFYESFFTTGSIIKATRAGREKMRRNAQRVCARGLYDLQDWLLPVLYQQQELTLDFKNALEFSQPEEVSALPDDAQVRGDFGFIGRDRMILALERALRNQPQGAILIHGMAGIGKTTLAQGFLQWLQQTGGKYRLLWFGFEGIRFGESVIDQIVETIFGFSARSLPLKKKLAAVVQALRQKAYLLVWDNFESTASFSQEDRELLRQVIQGIRKGPSKIIITSRSPESWLVITECFPLPLDGLRGEEMWQYCNAVVELLGLTLKRDPVFQTLMQMLEGHPLAMRAILLRLKEKTAAELVMELDKEFQGQVGDESTEKIHQALEIFMAGLPEDFKTVLSLLGLHRRFMDFRVVGWMIQAAQLSLSPSRIAACSSALENGGMIQRIQEGVYRLHPALPGYLMQREPAQPEVLRGFVTVMAQIADHFALKELHEQRGVFQIHTGNFHSAREYTSGLENDLAFPALTQSLAVWGQNNRDFVSAKRLYEELRAFHHKWGNAAWEAGACHQLGRIAEVQRHFSEAEGWYKKSLAIKERLENESGAAKSYHQLGIVAQEQRHFSEAEGWYKKSLAIKERLGEELLAATTYHQLGIIAQEQDHFPAAEGWYEKSLAITERLGDESGAANAYHQLGIIAEKQGNFPAAEGWTKKSLEIKERLGDESGAANSYHQLGMIAEEQGDFPAAEAWYKKSLAIQERLGNKPGAAGTYHQLGILAINNQEYQVSAGFFQRALTIFMDVGDEYLSGICQKAMLYLLSRAGPTSQAQILRLWNAEGMAEWPIGDELKSRLLQT